MSHNDRVSAQVALHNSITRGCEFNLTANTSLYLVYACRLTLAMPGENPLAELTGAHLLEGGLLAESSDGVRLEVTLYHGRTTAQEDMQGFGYAGPKYHADAVHLCPAGVFLYNYEGGKPRLDAALPWVEDMLFIAEGEQPEGSPAGYFGELGIARVDLSA